MTDGWQIIEAISTGVAAFAASVTSYWAFTERREKIKARTAKAAAESELKNIQRRAHAPFLKPSADLFHGLYVRLGGNNIGFVVPGQHRCMLCESVDEVQMDDGDDVIFVIENLGANARGTSVKLDGKPIRMDREADMESAASRIYLVYPYEKSKHGKEQVLTLTFESESGVQDTHSYVTKHGCRILRRIDPPLP